jgi:hypothetical protein
MLLLAGMGPPGGGRTVISPRLQSRFNLINMTFPSVGFDFPGKPLTVFFFLSSGNGNSSNIRFDDQSTIS